MQKNNRHEEYNELRIFILTEKVKRQEGSVDISNPFKVFSVKSSIYDLNDLLKQAKSLETPTLEKILRYIEGETSFRVITQSEIVYEDVGRLIDLLWETLGKPEKGANFKSYLDDLSEERASRDFLECKNEINSVSISYFNSDILNSIAYGYIFDEYLGEPENRERFKRYDLIVYTIQDRLLSKDIAIEVYFNSLLEVITPSIKNAKDIPKILYMLNHMYFKCDIGIMPK